jgi:dTDP-3-amino-2,3,6-trideoxy-4-keto-D-glucose/dTDP-3-amino-3,4,6-trideoxy-alpha-D-glucose/dTDP-2,6-dideoxy-D-kanosamine transaminase
MIKAFDYQKDIKKDKKFFLLSFQRVLNSGNLILGKEVEKFEKNFSKFIGTKYGVGVGNCTDAIYISLKALNIGPGDEVITVANTAIPTITAIVNSGAKPKFADIGKDYLMEPKNITKLITKNTKAIIPVHLYGQTCNMEEIIKIAKKFKIKIIEDCAQSTGSRYQKKISGSFGDMGCFSFYPTKVLGGFGDGGFITTNNKNLYKKIRNLRYMGIETNKDSKQTYKNLYYAYQQGTNSRLDEIQAAMLNIKLNKIKVSIKKRQINAERYYKNLNETNLILPQKNSKKFDVFYEFIVRHKNRNKIIKILKKKGINLKITYPFPIYKMKPYKIYGSKFLLKNTEKFSKEIFSLPVYPGITDKQITKICNEIKKII